MRPTPDQPAAISRGKRPAADSIYAPQLPFMPHRKANAMVRAKFRCQSIIAPYEGAKEVRFEASVGPDDDNKSWSQHTPSGSLVMTITNPAASDQFAVGADYFLDFTPAV